MAPFSKPAVAWQLFFAGCLLAARFGLGQQPVDLFPDAPAHAAGFVRIGVWNVRHLDVEASSEDYFSGTRREDDFAILIASFAKAVRDLQLDVLALIEVQPRAGEPDRLEELVRDLQLYGGAGWRSDSTRIGYDEPDDPYGNLQFGLLWNAARGVSVEPARNRVLEELRQPRSPSGELLRQENRAPWWNSPGCRGRRGHAFYPRAPIGAGSPAPRRVRGLEHPAGRE
jgi:hypothetical protein